MRTIALARTCLEFEAGADPSRSAPTASKRHISAAVERAKNGAAIGTNPHDRAEMALGEHLKTRSAADARGASRSFP
jgi:hypothetical protein